MSETNPIQSAWIVNATPDKFEQDVFEKSLETLIVVDFWAVWCAPCRALTPILEKLVNEYQGKFILVKANTEEVPKVAEQFDVQGIPAVYGVCNGEVLDTFNGALPEQHIRSWIDRLLDVSAMAKAERLEETAPAKAEAQYREILENRPRDDAVKIGLARVLLAQDKIEQCQTMINELETRGFLEPDAEKIKSTLEIQAQQDNSLLKERRAAAATNPENLQLQLQLAESLAGAEEYEESLATCLALVQKDRKGVGEPARELMLKIFRVLPDDAQLTTEFRRKLSLALY